jgi:hypothetical protein
MSAENHPNIRTLIIPRTIVVTTTSAMEIRHNDCLMLSS